MNTTRIAAAALSTLTTLALFSAVVNLAEPQRGELMAKLQPAPAASSPAALAVANADAAVSMHAH
jgi:hypothetical protein